MRLVIPALLLLLSTSSKKPVGPCEPYRDGGCRHCTDCSQCKHCAVDHGFCSVCLDANY